MLLALVVKHVSFLPYCGRKGGLRGFEIEKNLGFATYFETSHREARENFYQVGGIVVNDGAWPQGL